MIGSISGVSQLLDPEIPVWKKLEILSFLNVNGLQNEF
jgi:hypothetical protein